MIKCVNVSKRIDNLEILNDINVEVHPGSIIGLVGPNGVGKTTLLRTMAGIYKPTHGTVMVDGLEIYKDISAKEKIIFLSDDLFYFKNATLNNLKNFYEVFYSDFDINKYNELIRQFNIDPNKKIKTFSKGIKRQITLIIGISCRPKYLLLDESFDGLDPINRLKLKQILADIVSSDNTAIIITSHNLRELEDICDRVFILEDKSIVYDDESPGNKSMYRFHVVFPERVDKAVFKHLNPRFIYGEERIFTLVLEGDIDELINAIEVLKPQLYEFASLSLEDLFLYQLGGKHD